MGHTMRTSTQMLAYFSRFLAVGKVSVGFPLAEDHTTLRMLTICMLSEMLKTPKMFEMGCLTCVSLCARRLMNAEMSLDSVVSLQRLRDASSTASNLDLASAFDCVDGLLEGSSDRSEGWKSQSSKGSW